MLKVNKTKTKAIIYFSIGILTYLVDTSCNELYNM